MEILGQKKSAVVNLYKNFPCILLITDDKKKKLSPLSVFVA